MIDSILIHELIYGHIDWPTQMHSDVARISYMARENNVSLEEIKITLEKFISTYNDDYDSNISFAKMWLQTVNNAIQAQSRLTDNMTVLDTKLSGTGEHQYGAYMKKEKEKGKWVVSIVQKRTDDEYGRMTGVPNAEYWDGTPGYYYASTILGWDKYSERGGDALCIDGGQNWCIYGMNELRDEIEEKYGDDIKAEMKMDESLDVLKGKTQSEIADSFPKSWDIKKAYDFLTGIGLTVQIIDDISRHTGQSYYILYIEEFENEILLYYSPKDYHDGHYLLPKGWAIEDDIILGRIFNGLTWYQAKVILLDAILAFNKENL